MTPEEIAAAEAALDGLDEEFTAVQRRYREAVVALNAEKDREIAALLGVLAENVTPFLRGFAAAWYGRADLLTELPGSFSSPGGEGDGHE